MSDDSAGTTGVILDADVAEIGISLGTIEDREGLSGTAEADFGQLGAELYSNGKLAGSGARVSLIGPGGGFAVSKINTTTIESNELGFNYK